MAWMRRTLVLYLIGMALLEQPSWVWGQAAPAARRANEITPGLVIIVEGIGGLDLVGIGAELALHHAGLPHELHHFNWTHGTGRYLRDLQDTQHILKKSEELAAFIRAYRARHPERPIYVVGKSAGTCLVLFALQQLAPNTVERVILLSPAVSPTFDLRGPLRSTRREVVSFYSCNDRMVLGLGTSQFGTADRFYGKSAGLTGFVVPSPLSEEDRRTYQRLIQVPWTTRMLLEGATGSHKSTSMPRFLAAEVVPWLQ
jgi:pimeloyl-ACP methyl ester carboxylesterase